MVVKAEARPLPRARISPGGVRELAADHWPKALGPVVEVPIRSLGVEKTPRVPGERPKHIKALAAVLAQLPPIVVHRPTMRVVDGVHRLRAAELCGQEFIAAYMLDGDEVYARASAAQKNPTSMRLLSTVDRKAFAQRLITLCPTWSDRLIALIVNLSAKTIRGVRRSCQGRIPPLTEGRVGRDGRVRPVNAAAKRELAADLLRKSPEMSLRQVAKKVGISPETVRAVRNRLRLGEEATEAGVGPAGPTPASASQPRSPKRTTAAEKSRRHPQRHTQTTVRAGSPTPARQRAAVVGRLLADPALRYNQHGRILLRLLKAHTLTEEQWATILNGLPAHCRDVLADVVLEHAKGWLKVARVLSGSARSLSPGHPLPGLGGGAGRSNLLR